MKYVLAVCTAALMSAAVGWAQPDTLWTGTYGLREYDYSYSVLEMSDGGFVVSGSHSAPSHWALARINSNGTQRWFQTFGNEGTCANDLQPIGGGGWLLAGLNHTNAMLIRTDTAGTPLWTQTYGDSGSSFVSLVRSSNGNFIAAGKQTDSTRTSLLYTCVDSTGHIVWSRTYSGPANPGLSLTMSAICATQEGGFVGVGTVDTVDAVINEDFFIICVNHLGDTLWTRAIGTMDRQFARSVQNTGGGFVIGGHDVHGSTFSIHVFKLNGNGVLLWDRVITAIGNATCAAAYEIEGGDLIVGGTIIAGMSGVPEFFLARVAPNDSVEWEQHYGGSGAEWAEDMKLTSDGGAVMTGRTNSFDSQQWDFYVVRTGSVHSTEFAESHGALPVDPGLISYPNPFNSDARIEFNLRGAESVRLVIYDVLGRNVEVLADGRMESGAHSLRFDGSSLPSGIYLARLQAGSAVQTKKMVLLK